MKVKFNKKCEFSVEMFFVKTFAKDAKKAKVLNMQ